MVLDWSNQHLHTSTECVVGVSTNYSPKTLRFETEKRHKPTVDEIGVAIKTYIDTLREMEKLFLQETAFIAGDEITIADIQTACQLMFCRVINTDLSSFPLLNNWFTRVQKHIKAWTNVHTEFEDFVAECIRLQKLNQAHESKIKKHGKDAAGGNRQPDVYHTVYFQKPPEEVWKMLTNPASWAPSSVKESEFSEKPGGKFSYHDSVEGTNLYLQTNTRLLQSWRTTDWPAGVSSTVRINMEPESQNGTKLILLQQDVPPNFVKKTDDLWSGLFWKPIGGVLVRNILQQLFFDNLSPHTMYKLLTDSQVCSKLTKTKCEIGRGVGTDINILDGAVTGKNIELITDVKVSF